MCNLELSIANKALEVLRFSFAGHTVLLPSFLVWRGTAEPYLTDIINCAILATLAEAAGITAHYVRPLLLRDLSLAQ